MELYFPPGYSLINTPTSGMGGPLQVDSTVEITNILNIELGNMVHYGTILNRSSGTVVNKGPATLSSMNGSIIENEGIIENRGIWNSAGEVNNTGTINNTATGNFTITGTFNGNTGTITNNGTLRFNLGSFFDYGGRLEGAGTLIKQGNEKLTLSGDSSLYSGSTTVTAGELAVKNSLSNSDVTLSGGTTLSGTGTVKSLTFSPGATYGAKINPDGSSEYITVSGTTDINITNGNLIIDAAAGTYSAGSAYTILQGSIPNGATFASVITTGSPVKYKMVYNAGASGTVQLTIRPNPLSTASCVGNPGAVVQYLNNYASEPLKDMLNNLDAAQLHDAVKQLSPDRNTQISTMVTTAETSHLDNAFAWFNMDRLVSSSSIASHLVEKIGTKFLTFKQNFSQISASKLHHKTTTFAISPSIDPKHIPAFGRLIVDKVTFWLQGSGGRFSQNNTDDTAGNSVQGLDGSSYNTSVGADYALTSHFKLGVTTSYTHNIYKTKGQGDKGSTNSTRFGVYGLWNSTPLYVQGTISYGRHCFRSNRSMTIIRAVASQKHGGHHISGLLEIGRDIALENSTTLTPYLSGGALHLREEKYTEKGAGIQNLRVDASHSATVQGKTGLQLAKLWNGKGEIPVYSFAKMGATYQSAINKNRKVKARLAGQSANFTVVAKNRSHLLFNPSVGVSTFLKEQLSTSLVYEGEMGASQRSHQAMIQLNWTM
ncbi:MAG: autotransporter domain-containing protein [Candidatus Paracaedibacteraceae bacterium]|nr:autotransporter domain-containing protein [Candidatus Paracaedibacteraceae bacterium]